MESTCTLTLIDGPDNIPSSFVLNFAELGQGTTWQFGRQPPARNDHCVALRHDKALSSRHAEFSLVDTPDGIYVGVRDCASTNGTDIFTTLDLARQRKLTDGGLAAALRVPRGSAFNAVEPHILHQGNVVRIGHSTMILVEYSIGNVGAAERVSDEPQALETIALAHVEAEKENCFHDATDIGLAAVSVSAAAPAPTAVPTAPIADCAPVMPLENSDDAVIIVDEVEVVGPEHGHVVPFKQCSGISLPLGTTAQSSSPLGTTAQSKLFKQSDKGKKRGRAAPKGKSNAGGFDEPPFKLPAKVGTDDVLSIGMIGASPSITLTQEETPAAKLRAQAHIERFARGDFAWIVKAETAYFDPFACTLQPRVQAGSSTSSLAGAAGAVIRAPQGQFGSGSNPCLCMRMGMNANVQRALVAGSDDDVRAVYAALDGVQACAMLAGVEALLGRLKRVRAVCGEAPMGRQQLSGKAGQRELLPPSTLIVQANGESAAPSLLRVGTYKATGNALTIPKGTEQAEETDEAMVELSQGYTAPPWNMASVCGASDFDHRHRAGASKTGHAASASGPQIDLSVPSPPFSRASATHVHADNAGTGQSSEDPILSNPQCTPLPCVSPSASTPALASAMKAMGLRPGDRAYMLRELQECGALTRRLHEVSQEEDEVDGRLSKAIASQPLLHEAALLGEPLAVAALGVRALPTQLRSAATNLGIVLKTCM